MSVSSKKTPAKSAESNTKADPWRKLRQFSHARIGLGHAGISQPTSHHLAFQLAHAQARDAVYSKLEPQALSNQHHSELILHSAAKNRDEYLQRPDFGRRLNKQSRQQLETHKSVNGTAYDAVFIIADGLSAEAIHRHATPTLDAVKPILISEQWRIPPTVIVEQGRVAISDEIGALLNAQMVVILIGERPGLSAPDSLGIYLTYAPKPGRTDAQRNCISNIRHGGLGYQQAAHKLLFLMREARLRKCSGFTLKDETEALTLDEHPRSQQIANFLVNQNPT